VRQHNATERVQELANRVDRKCAKHKVADLAVDLPGALLPAVPRHDEMGEGVALGANAGALNRAQLCKAHLLGVRRTLERIARAAGTRRCTWAWPRSIGATPEQRRTSQDPRSSGRGPRVESAQ